MCLVAKKDGGEPDGTKVCAQNQTIVLLNADSRKPRGILGLAKGHDSNNFVSSLKKQGQIKNALIGIDLENSFDRTFYLDISIGQIDDGKVLKGKAGLSYYSNVGRNKWALQIDNFKYGQRVLSNTTHLQRGFIDSGNFSI